MTKLTAKQAIVLEYIQRYITERRRSPFIREIQDGCQIPSYKAAVDRLNALERKGFIKRKPNIHRGIKVVNSERALAVLTNRPAPSPGAAALPEPRAALMSLERKP